MTYNICYFWKENHLISFKNGLITPIFVNVYTESDYLILII